MGTGERTPRSRDRRQRGVSRISDPAARCPGPPWANHGPRIVFGSAVVYPARVSDKPPQTYILHTVALFVVLVIIMVVFLKHQWG